MAHSEKTILLLKQFLNKLYITRSLQKVSDLTTADVEFCGTFYENNIKSSDELRPVLRNLFPGKKPVSVSYVNEFSSGSEENCGTATITANCESDSTFFVLIITGSTRMVNGIPKLYFVHFNLLSKGDLVITHLNEEDTLFKYLTLRYLFILRVNLSQDRVIGYINNRDSESYFSDGKSYSEVINRLVDCGQLSVDNPFSLEHIMQQYHEGKNDISIYRTLQLPNSRIRIVEYKIYIHMEANSELTAIICERDSTDSMKRNMILNKICEGSYRFIVLIDSKDNTYSIYAYHNKDIPNDSRLQNYDKDISEYIKRYIVPEEEHRVLKQITLKNVIKELKEHDNYQIQFNYKNSSGYIRYERMNYTYLSDEKRMILLMTQDVTSIVTAELASTTKLEQALKEATAASAAKTEFLSRMSHSIRTPLNAILGLTGLLERECTDSVMADYIKQLEHSGVFLAKLMDDVLDISSIENKYFTLHKSILTQEEFINSINTQILPEAKKKEIKVDFKLISNISSLYVDSARYEQIFINVLLNAIKFTPAGGRVSLTTRIIERKENTVFLQHIVKDNGIGMSSDFLKRVFSPFEQEKNGIVDQWQGTGLGLSITKEIVYAMNGNINIVSEPGKGTIVTINLPIEITNKNVEVKQDVNSRVLLANKHILIVEDNQINMLVTQKLMQMIHVTYDSVENGQLALNQFLNAPDYHYDAILMDIRMPVMSGIEASILIRQSDKLDAKSIPIIAVTANALTADIQETQDAGMNAHISKPINPELLFKTMVSVMK